MEKKYENYMSDAEIMKLYNKDKTHGTEKMLEKYNDYIYYIINKVYPSFHREIQDMYQNGVIGMMNAMTSYNPEKGTFTTHCTPYIKKEISKHVRFISSESSEYFAAIHTSVSRAKTKLETDGKEITVENVMEETGLSKKIVNRELKIDHTKVSYEALESMTSEISLTDNFMVNDILSVIPDENSLIIKMKVFDGLTFANIAEKLGKTPHTVRKEYHEGLNMLRESMEAC